MYAIGLSHKNVLGMSYTILEPRSMLKVVDAEFSPKTHGNTQESETYLILDVTKAQNDLID